MPKLLVALRLHEYSVPLVIECTTIGLTVPVAVDTSACAVQLAL